MKITKIKIDSFGVLRDREFILAPGINLALGENERGKTSLAMFIKFIFYGLSGRGCELFPMGERKRFINWDTMRAAGELEFEADGSAYRIERSVAYTGEGDSVRERKTVISLETGTPVKCPGEPGEMFFGVPESVFMNTVFVRQPGASSMDRREISSAVENILASADEKISVKKILNKLETVRRQLMYKNASGGDIPELEEEISALDGALRESVEKNAELISAKAALDDTVDYIEKLEAENISLERTEQIYSDLRALEDREELKKALAGYEEENLRLTELTEKYPEEKLREAISAVKTGISEENRRLTENEEKLTALLEMKQGDAPTEEECDEISDLCRELSGKARANIRLACVFFILAPIVLGAGAAVSFVTKLFPTSVAFAVCALLIIPGAVFLGMGLSAKKKLGKLLLSHDAYSPEELEDVLDSKRKLARENMLRDAQIENAEKELFESKLRIAKWQKQGADLSELFPNSPEEELSADETVEFYENELRLLEKNFLELRESVAAAKGECRTMASRAERHDFDGIEARQAELRATAEWDKASSLDNDGFNRIRIARKMNQDKLRISYEKRTEYEKLLAQGRAMTKAPADIAEMLEAKRAELDLKKLRFDSLKLAIGTLEQSGERLRSQLMPRIVKNASAMFSSATGGKYSSLGVSSDFEMTVTDGDGTKSADYLSTGGSDAAYICLRLALGEAIFGKESAPLILDESFGTIDERRTGELFSILDRSDLQTIVFTCRPGEAELLPAENVISL